LCHILKMNQQISFLQKELEPLRAQLIAHPLYANVRTISDFQIFTEQHVFAVWDFMSLLKELQRKLTCTSIPWSPVGSPVTRRFINEIVLGEESDIDQNGNITSHFELYLEAMKELGSNQDQIQFFQKTINQGLSIQNALEATNVFEETKDFVNFTFDTIYSGKLHSIAAVFTFGREDLIPEMFVSILQKMKEQGNNQVSTLLYYLERHIEVDGDDHGPISLKMMEEICLNDQKKWEEALIAAQNALNYRIHLWNGILKRL
jgi:hypothetical protein